MNWQPLFELVIQLVVNCLEQGKSDDEILARIEDPGPVLDLIVERRARQQMGLTRREWRKRRNEFYALVEEQRHEAALELLEQAKEIRDAESPTVI